MCHVSFFIDQENNVAVC